MTLFEELEWRGMVSESTEGVREALARERVTAYIGFDPTASSLHIGNLLTVMGLARLQNFGHTPIAIVGGGTGMIGDPSGKSQERNLLSAEQIDLNLTGVRAQLEHFLDFNATENAATIVNNADWLGAIDLLSYLRDVGKHFTVNYMLQKESVSRRLESADGISYTEFSYLVLQAYDFLQLFDRRHCTLQMGGTDQWGNITAGIELIRRVRGKKAHGLVWPLLKTAAGTKFGKTEAGTVWLDPQRTSERDFYQFWLQTDDRDVINHLKIFTWLDRSEIERLARDVEEDPAGRSAQRRLADEVTRMVHGESALAQAQGDAALRFGGAVTAEALQNVAPTASITIDKLTAGLANTELVVIAGLAKSKSEAFRLIEQGGITINDAPVFDPRALVSLDQARGNRFKVSRGRRGVAIVEVTGGEPADAERGPAK
ncbi:MAG: tyrosine--tRNA ligase [Vicinamibacterales bacterium]